MKKFLYSVLAISFLASLPSCKLLYPSAMFKEKDYQYFELAKKQVEQYLLQPGDELTLKVYSRDGFKLIDVIGALGSAEGESASSYLVDNEGFAKLPVLGDFFVKGYSESELETVLAEKLAGLFVEPYVVVEVVNRRAFIFRGSAASIVKLNTAPTTLLEVIAAAGGLSGGSSGGGRGEVLKAYKIKIIRGDLKNPEIHLVDLSTLEGIRNTDLIVQGNDIIYIETKKNIARDLLQNFTPYIALVSTISTLIILGTTFGK
jgi:polysaccharide export outer membrane protein